MASARILFRPLRPCGLALLAVLLARPAQSALIQLRGRPLEGGRARGSVIVPLERARAGDTPVLTFSSPRGAVRLLLDTGATSSMVTPPLASRLGLISQPLPAATFALAGAGSSCPGLQPRRVRLPPLTLRGVRGPEPAARSVQIDGAEALVMPVNALPPGVDGVLGVPTLRLLPFSIDPQRGRLSLGGAALSADNVPAGQPRQQLPLRWHRGVPLLQLTTRTGAVSALADTGAEGFFISSELASRLKPIGSAYPLRLVGFCGQQVVRSQSMAGVALGAVQRAAGGMAKSLNAPITAIITENPIFKQLGVEAIVGQEWLRHRMQRWRLDRQPPVLEIW